MNQKRKGEDGHVSIKRYKVERDKRTGDECNDNINKKHSGDDIICHLTTEDLPGPSGESGAFSGDSEKFEKNVGLPSSVSGTLFQVRLLILVLQRAVNRKYDFLLATEMKAAEKFDDLVFQYVKKNTDKKDYIFLQAKHRTDESKLISYNDLSAEQEDFSLPKYFLSYRKMKTNFDFKKESLNDFVLFTNINLNIEDLATNGVKVIDVTKPNNLLVFRDIQKTPGCYRLCVNSDHPLYEKLKETSDLHILATALIHHIKCSKLIILKDIFKYYHTALVHENVIEIIERGKKNIGKFKKQFIDLDPDDQNSFGFSESAKKLRKLLQNQLNKYSLSLNEDIELKLSHNFGKMNCEEATMNSQRNLPRDVIDEEEINEFFHKLSLAVNQPNVDELGKVIEDEFGDTFNLLDSDLSADHIQKQILEWFKENHKEGRFLTFKDGKKLLKSTKQNIYKFISLYSTMDFKAKIEKFAIQFHQENLDELKIVEFLANKSKQILCLVTDHLTLSAIKLYQVLKNIPVYKTEDSYIYTQLGSLLRMQKRILDAFKSHKSNHLLIIKYTDNELVNENQISELVKQLYKIINLKATKKIVVLTERENIFTNRLSENHRKQVDIVKDEKNSLTHLTNSSQEKLLTEGKFLLQGKEFCVGDIIDEASRELIDGETICKLINSEIIHIGCDTFISSGYDKQYYVERTLRPEFVIKPAIIHVLNKMNNNYLLGIGNTDKNKFCRTWCENKIVSLCDEKYLNLKCLVNCKILDNEEVAERFPKSFMHSDNSNIYLWIETMRAYEFSGSFDNLIIKVKNDSENSIDIILNYPEKYFLLNHSNEGEIVVISDTAGMGKSTVLSSLTNKLKNNTEPLWVIRIDLNNYTELLDKESNGKMDINFAVNFLFEAQQLQGVTRLESQLFKHSFKKQSKIKIALLLDGFDETCPNYKDTVTDLLRILKNNYTGLLLLTTRPNMRQYLKDHLNVCSYTLTPFSENNKLQFLTDFWSKTLVSDNKIQIRKYANALINKFNESIKDELKEFTGIPLQMRMIAEIFQENIDGRIDWQSCKEFISGPCNIDPNFPPKLNTLELYEEFSRKKIYNHYLQEKMLMDFTKPGVENLAKNNLNYLNSKHELLAMHRLGLTELLSEKDLKILMDEFKTGEWNTGLVNQIINNKPQFIHLTFAEYFASCFLVNKIFSDSDNIIKRINSIIANTSLVFVTSIVRKLEIKRELISLLKGKTLVNFVTQLGCLDFVKALLEAGYWDFPKPDCFQKTPLHYAAEFGHEDIVKYLLMLKHEYSMSENSTLEQVCFKAKEIPYHKLAKFLNKVDQYGNTALDYAVKNNHKDVATILLLKGAEVKGKDVQLVAEELLNRVSNSSLKLSKHNIHPRLTFFFLRRGRIEVLRSILSTMEDKNERKQLLNEEYNSCTPLDCVNESNKLSDANRLEITKFLIENGGTAISCDLIMYGFKGDDCYIMRILQAATNFGHINTFRNFIEQHRHAYYDEKFYYEHLCLACVSNQLNIIEYLLEKFGKYFNQPRGNLSYDRLEKFGRHVILGENTPMHVAVMSLANLSVIKCVVDKGFDINARNEREETPLFYAIYDNRIEVVKYLVDHGADVNAQDREGKTPLYYSLQYDRQDIIKYLLFKCKAKVSSPFGLIRKKLDFYKNPFDFKHEGIHRLHRAIQSRNLKWSKFLIKHGANINTKDEIGWTPLHWACKGRYFEIVELLLQYGAIYNESDLSNKTPSDLYSNSIKKSKIKWLLHVLDKLFKSRSVMEDLNKWFYSKKWGPYGSGHPDAWDRDFPLIIILNVRNCKGRTLLHVIAGKNDLQAIKSLLSYNYSCLREANSGKVINRRTLDHQPVSVDVKDLEGNTPLHLAAKKGHYEMASILLKRGAVFNTMNKQGHTPKELANANRSLCKDVVELLELTESLFDAVKQKDLTKVKTCISKGAYINVKYENGKTHLDLAGNIENQMIHNWTPLHLAAVLGQLDIALFLINNKANVEATDINSRTPLHVATVMDNIEIVKLLLKKGAFYNALDKEDKAPFDVTSNKSAKLLKFVDKLFSDILSDNPRVIFENDLSVFKSDYDTEKSVPINAFNNQGKTLLHYSAQSNCFDIGQMLLRNGSIFNAKDKVEAIAESYTKNFELKNLLKSLRHMFDDITIKEDKVNDVQLITNVRGADGMTLLHKAAECGKSKVIKWLIEHHVNINAVDYKGRTALHCAAQEDMVNVVQLLIQKGADINARDDDGADYRMLLPQKGDI